MKIIQNETNIGLVRKKNEDVALSLTHPKDKNIILLLVADGMGGKEFGDIAAKTVAKAIEKWFLGRSISTLSNIEKAEDQLRETIEKVNSFLIDKYGENVLGTTLAMALITEGKTLMLNVGDSRVYIYRKKKLIQVSEDASDVWYYYKYGVVRKDDLRYFYHNNIITSCVGIAHDLCQIDSTILVNDYDMILLFTDGVTDLITDRKIKKVIDMGPKKEILSNIIHEAVNEDQHLKVPLRLKRKKFSKYILPYRGRDNASGAIYIK
jgi:protein phosphatase